jgi:hypothetical protein
MKVLLHVCCAPCAIVPVAQLREEGLEVMGFFYRHNIHPYTECLKRQQTLEGYAGSVGLNVIYQKGYDLEGFVRQAAFREADRCRFCYHDRLKATALLAISGRFDGFSSTLLYSRFQKHDLIRSIGEAVAAETGIAFLYRDFRSGWGRGVAASKALGLYRQPYCGCIYSEKERYYKNKAQVEVEGKKQTGN